MSVSVLTFAFTMSSSDVHMVSFGLGEIGLVVTFMTVSYQGGIRLQLHMTKVWLRWARGSVGLMVGDISWLLFDGTFGGRWCPRAG